MELSKLGLVSKLNQMVGHKPAATAAPAPAPAFQRDSLQLIRQDANQQLALAMRHGIARLDAHFNHKSAFALGVKRTDDVAMTRKQIAFLAALGACRA